mgnify:FL=1
MSKPLATDEIRNRIIEVKRIRFGDIKKHERNPRIHGEAQRQAFRGSVRELGFTSMPLAYMSERAGGLCWADGHLRGSEVAGYEGDVAILDINDAEADKLLLYADPIASMAEYESQQLSGLLADIGSEDEALRELLAELGETADTLGQGEIGEPGKRREMGDRKKQIKPVLYSEQIAVFEQAILATGERNRGEALIEICEFYLAQNEKGQFYSTIQSIAASELA